MADREKVINALEHCIDGCFDNCPYEYGGAVTLEYCRSDLMRDALELLKEQEPEEPLIILKGKVDEVYDYLAECPKCGMEWAMWHSEKMRYCPGCGRAVKWDDIR